LQSPDICRRCAETGPTCCWLNPGGVDALFPISDPEWRRIREAFPDAGGFQQVPNSADFLCRLARLFPREKNLLPEIFHPRKHHYALAVKEEGGCRFLGPSGCVIPLECRPYYCRIFPFWVTDNDVCVVDFTSCLAWREGRSTFRMTEFFGLTEAQIRDLHGRLRIAWGFPPKAGMEFAKKGL